MSIGSGSTFSNIINRSADSTSKELGSLFKKLSSGLRINSASDDAAGLAVAQSLSASIVSLGQAGRNIGDLTSFTQIAEGALGQIGELAQRKAELATQSANGTLSDTQRQTLQAEDTQLTAEISRIASTTQFNGINVFQGTSGQVGADGSANSQLSIGGTNISALITSLSSQNIGTQGAAQTAIDAVKTFTDAISTQRGQVGASQSRLQSVGEGVESQKLNQTEAKSRILDLDYAEALSRKVSLDILSQVQPALLAQAFKLNAQNIQKLLG